MLERVGFDWSDQPSGKTLDDASPFGLGGRSALSAGIERQQPRNGLAEITDADLIRHLNLVKGERDLTNAGALLFVTTPWAGEDYIRARSACERSPPRVWDEMFVCWEVPAGERPQWEEIGCACMRSHRQ